MSGNIFGKHKLYEKVSPNKTWEGFAGGFAFTILMGFILDQYVYVDAGYAPYFWMKSAIFIAPAAVAGDLFQSALKRKMKVRLELIMPPIVVLETSPTNQQID
mgnify:CR=1 FL=1